MLCFAVSIRKFCCVSFTSIPWSHVRDQGGVGGEEKGEGRERGIVKNIATASKPSDWLHPVLKALKGEKRQMGTRWEHVFTAR